MHLIRPYTGLDLGLGLTLFGLGLDLGLTVLWWSH